MFLVSLLSAALAAIFLLGVVWHFYQSPKYARWYRDLFGPLDRY